MHLLFSSKKVWLCVCGAKQNKKLFSFFDFLTIDFYRLSGCVTDEKFCFFVSFFYFIALLFFVSSPQKKSPFCAILKETHLFVRC